MEGYIKNILSDRRKKHLFRELIPVRSLPNAGINVDGREYINFSSNDYLSFSSELVPDLNREIFFSGTCASRLMTGTTPLHQELEERTAEFKQKPAALVFNSGYQANTGVISTLVDKNDVVFSDKLNHASMVDGIKLSQSSCYRYKHNDIDHLESLLKKHRKDFRRSLILTETVFSMDGDIAPVKKIAGLKDQYDSMLMVDEAHATGIFGENGSGIVEREQVSDSVDIIMGTYSKALAGFGAYVACSKSMKAFLVNYCRSLIYSTSLPEYVMAVNLSSLEKIKDDPFRRSRLLENAGYLRKRLKERGFETCGETQIIPIISEDIGTTLSYAERLKKRGYWVTAVRPPTVPAGKSRIRLSLSYSHTTDVIERFVNDLTEIRKTG